MNEREKELTIKVIHKLCEGDQIYITVRLYVRLMKKPNKELHERIFHRIRGNRIEKINESITAVLHIMWIFT